MANEITEKGCLEAELVLGYKYYALQDNCKKKITACSQTVNKLESEKFEDRNAYVQRRDSAVGAQTYIAAKHPEWEQEYWAYIKKADVEARAKDEEQFKKNRSEERQGHLISAWVLTGISAILLLLTVIFHIIGINEANGDFGAAFQEGGLIGVAWFLAMCAAPAVVFAVKNFSAARKVQKESDCYRSTKKAEVITLQNFLTQKVEAKGVKEELRAAYDAENQAAIAAFEEKEKQIQAKIDQKKAELSSLKKTEADLVALGERTVTILQEIPAFYFKPEAVEKMLFFYVNKRADNIRDLINLYETTVFQEAVLRSLKDIAVSVDRLAETVRGSFQRLGLQLGVLNESIRENTKVQRLSVEKLAEIKDENARHYLEVVDAIGEVEFISNTYVTTEITIE